MKMCKDWQQVGTKIGPVPYIYRTFPDFTQCVFAFLFLAIFQNLRAQVMLNVEFFLGWPNIRYRYREVTALSEEL